ncbi:Hypothetical protein AA314_02692 [Archangium gephyra]|uniref:Uncharacterized protein n=1 Tax=Archangium gephyra TaxID=48 RepID=A0AAC8TDZ6_9BACT|nr:Hypothetical protein AA314_02692 [Archangium gephyra]
MLSRHVCHPPSREGDLAPQQVPFRAQPLDFTVREHMLPPGP